MPDSTDLRQACSSVFCQPITLFLQSALLSLQIITAPFATGFNHLKIANEIYFKLDRCHRSIFGSSDLPIYGMGHSMGSLMHILMATQFPVQRAGNVLMSFNNKDVLESIPFFAPFISPGARALAPILTQASFQEFFTEKTWRLPTSSC